MQEHSDVADAMTVTLTAAQAKQVAEVIRIRIAVECDPAWTTPLPRREDVERLRTLFDLYGDQLEMLQWGEPTEPVELSCSRPQLEAIARNLLEGGEATLANPLGWNPGDVARVRQRGRDMIIAAEAINDALAKRREFAMAS